MKAITVIIIIINNIIIITIIIVVYLFLLDLRETEEKNSIKSIVKCISSIRFRFRLLLSWSLHTLCIHLLKVIQQIDAAWVKNQPDISFYWKAFWFGVHFCFALCFFTYHILLISRGEEEEAERKRERERERERERKKEGGKEAIRLDKIVWIVFCSQKAKKD